MKYYVKIALFFVVFIAIGSILAALILFNKKHPDTAKVKPDFVLTATVLQKDFENNETAASSKYINKILEVTGTIVSVTAADSTNTNISLKTGNEMSSVICTFHKLADTSRFIPGNEISLRGECSGFLMDVLLNNCSIIIKKE
jgi:hypothetical protein